MLQAFILTLISALAGGAVVARADRRAARIRRQHAARVMAVELIDSRLKLRGARETQTPPPDFAPMLGAWAQHGEALVTLPLSAWTAVWLCVRGLRQLEGVSKTTRSVDMHCLAHGETLLADIGEALAMLAPYLGEG